MTAEDAQRASLMIESSTLMSLKHHATCAICADMSNITELCSGCYISRPPRWKYRWRRLPAVRGLFWRWGLRISARCRFLCRILVECHGSVVSCHSCNISTFGNGNRWQRQLCKEGGERWAVQETAGFGFTLYCQPDLLLHNMSFSFEMINIKGRDAQRQLIEVLKWHQRPSSCAPWATVNLFPHFQPCLCPFLSP